MTGKKKRLKVFLSPFPILSCCDDYSPLESISTLKRGTTTFTEKVKLSQRWALFTRGYGREKEMAGYPRATKGTRKQR